MFEMILACALYAAPDQVAVAPVCEVRCCKVCPVRKIVKGVAKGVKQRPKLGRCR